jgi:hypothetical protein
MESTGTGNAFLSRSVCTSKKKSIYSKKYFCQLHKALIEILIPVVASWMPLVLTTKRFPQDILNDSLEVGPLRELPGPQGRSRRKARTTRGAL